MKHFMTLMALAFAFTAGAQTGLVEFPYNPDADNDDIIGVNDLMELLSFFGNEFTDENLAINEDETSAIYQVSGEWDFLMCKTKCVELPSNKWRMIDVQTLTEFRSQLPIANIWLSNEELIFQDGNSILAPYLAVSGALSHGGTTLQETCVCETHERPKVEYSYCSGSSLQSCADGKVADGWYPLSGIASNPTFSGSAGHSSQMVYQAFWRWAE